MFIAHSWICKKVDQMEDTPIVRGRGKPEKITGLNLFSSLKFFRSILVFKFQMLYNLIFSFSFLFVSVKIVLESYV